MSVRLAASPGHGPAFSANSLPFSETACAKINLFLHVTGRRPDGYHLLDSLAVFAKIGDRLDAVAGTGVRLSLSGPFAAALQPDAGDNLVLRAARMLAAELPEAELPGVHLELAKHLPVASGIGGGSADAAAALRLLRRFWGLETVVSDRRLHELAAGLGADVPVCLAQRPARMRGIGEILDEAPNLPAFGMVLINCGKAVATQAVFKARAAGFTASDPAAAEFTAAAELPRGWSDAASLAASLALLSNDLQAAACSLCPEIDAVLAALRSWPGCRIARMSGSGATCFGVFDDADAAQRAAQHRARPAHWWVWGGAIHRPEF